MLARRDAVRRRLLRGGAGRWLAPLAAALAVTLAGVPAGAAAGSNTGPTVSVSAAPARARSHQPVHFTVRVADPDAHGALGYRIAFGDGSTGSIALPQYCTANGRKLSGTWHLVHRYARAGSYRVRVTGMAVCSGGGASGAVTVKIG